MGKMGNFFSCRNTSAMFAPAKMSEDKDVLPGTPSEGGTALHEAHGRVTSPFKRQVVGSSPTPATYGGIAQVVEQLCSCPPNFLMDRLQKNNLAKRGA